jgi:hypothetical protein
MRTIPHLRVAALAVVLAGSLTALAHAEGSRGKEDSGTLPTTYFTYDPASIALEAKAYQDAVNRDTASRPNTASSQVNTTTTTK